MESNKRPKLGEGESSIGGMKPSEDESKIRSGGSQSGQGSKSDQLVVGGVSVDSTEFGETFERASFTERMLYCIPNNIEEVDSHIMSKLYDLVMLQVSKETNGNIASKASILLQLPQKCLDDTIGEIIGNMIFPISENSKMRISQAAKAMKIIFEGLHTDKHRIERVLVLDLMTVFWRCRDGLAVLPDEAHTTGEDLRSVKMAIVEFIGAVLEDKSGDEASNAVCNVVLPLAHNYNAKFDYDLLPLFCKVLNENNKEVIQFGLLDTIIHISFQPIEGNHTSMKFSTSMCDLVEILWGRYYDYIFNSQTSWQKVMSLTFWALRSENIEITKRASNILVRVGNSLEGLDFSNNMGAYALVLDFIRDIFLGFSKNQDPTIFNSHANLAFMALSLTRKTGQEFDTMDVKKKIVDAFQISFHYTFHTFPDKIDNVVSRIIVSQNVDVLKDCLDSFLQEGGSSLSDLMEG